MSLFNSLNYRQFLIYKLEEDVTFHLSHLKPMDKVTPSAVISKLEPRFQTATGTHIAFMGYPEVNFINKSKKDELLLEGYDAILYGITYDVDHRLSVILAGEERVQTLFPIQILSTKDIEGLSEYLKLKDK